MIESFPLREAVAESKLSIDVVRAINAGRIEAEAASLFTPTEVLTGIAAMMVAVRKRQSNPVSGAMLLPPDPTKAETIFSEIASGLLEPCANDSSLQFIQREAHTNPGACHEAEPRFGGALHDRQSQAGRLRVGPVLVFSDMDGAPVFIQKEFGSDTALGLQEVAIDGVDYPAGTLFSLYSRAGQVLHKKYQVNERRCGKLRVRHHSTAEVDSIAPVRLSLYALSPEDRIIHEHLIPDNELEEKILELVQTATPQDFAEAFAR